jgi:hypothetical protein
MECVQRLSLALSTGSCLVVRELRVNLSHCTRNVPGRQCGPLHDVRDVEWSPFARIDFLSYLACKEISRWPLAIRSSKVGR